MAQFINRRNTLRIDLFSIFLYIFLVLWGWISIYAAVYNEEASSIFDLSQKYGKQLLWLGTSAILAFVVMVLDKKFFINLAPLWYTLTVLMLLGVLFLGKTVGGAKSWYAIGSFSLQPSEIAKFSTGLVLAYYLSFPRIDVVKWKYRIPALVLILLPGGLIALQPDLGSTLVYLSLVLVLYREGMPGYYIGAVLFFAALAIIGLILPLHVNLIAIGLVSLITFFLLPKKLKYILGNGVVTGLAMSTVFAVGIIMEQLLAPHQQVRIKVLLGLQEDPTGAGYNTLQSLIAIGSGGVSGKGFLQGTQTKLNFVPEQSTDYIFCTVGEEWGFIGTIVLMLSFGSLLARLIFLAERQRNTFNRVYGYSVASILFAHFVVNIGMTIGILPTIGIPLPFFSYGGSSLWGFTLLLFIFLKLDAERMNTLS